MTGAVSFSTAATYTCDTDTRDIANHTETFIVYRVTVRGEMLPSVREYTRDNTRIDEKTVRETAARDILRNIAGLKLLIEP